MNVWIRSFFMRWFDLPYRDDPAHARKMRAAWEKAAMELGLDHSMGNDTFGDRIDGAIDGRRIEVTYEANYAVQKPETIIRVCLDDIQNSSQTLDSKSLLEIYDENAGPHGKLIDEERAWLLGHRLGNGIRGNSKELSYHQLWSMYDSADIVFVCIAMLKVMPYLDPNRCKVQRSK
jgi:hypothetical protein